MTDTPNVAAPLWAASQASPWLTQDQAARIWDAFAVTVIVERMDLTAPPGACADGARFLVKGAATGLWAGRDGDLAIAVGANASNGWHFAEIALEGMVLYNRAEARNYRYESGTWTAFADTISRFQDLLDVTVAGLADGDVWVWDASNGLLFPQTIANLIAPILASYLIATLDTDGTLAANSDARVASQKATRTAIDAAVTGLLDLKGGQNCSANPNYPAASKGDYYFVTVAGKIGGASGTSVLAGDIFFATADNAGGTQGAVGGSWDVMHTSSLIGALLAANNLSDLLSAPAARGNLGSTTVGDNLFTVANPSAITFLRVNADNSVSALDAATFRTAIGAGTGGGSITGLTGDVTASGSGSVAATIANDAVTYAKMQNVSATSRILGRITAGAGDPEELTAANVKTILALASGDISGLTYFATGTDAANLTGTVAAARMPALTGDVTTSAGAVATTVGNVNYSATLTATGTPPTNAIGYLGAPQNIQNASYTTLLTDAGKHLYHTSGTAHTWTIDSNANVAYPIGTILTFINENGGGVITLAITSDTLRWGSSTGSRSLAANGTATAVKVTATVWRLTGDGIT